MTKTAALLASLALTAVFPAHAQQESNPAAERANIANQRIQAEAERQAQLQRQAAEAEARLQAEAEAMRAREAQSRAAAVTAASPPSPAQPPSDRPYVPSPDEQARMEKALQQIRSLGELRDAGYVTDEEFEQIKRRILDDRL